MKKEKKESESVEQLRAQIAEVRTKIISVALSLYEAKYEYKCCEHSIDYHICDVNGKRFIKISDIGSNASLVVKECLDDGTLLMNKDVLLFRMNDRYVNGRPIYLISHAALKKIRGRFREYRDAWTLAHVSFTKRLDCVIETADIAQAVSYNYTPTELIESYEACKKRAALLSEKKDATMTAERKIIMQEQRKQEEQENKSLMSLVEQIEAMGWEVTLKRRYNKEV